LLAYGALKDQSQLERDPEAVAELIETNFTSAVAWCLSTASVLERQRAGALLVIGSVASDMGAAIQLHLWRDERRSWSSG
jgi:short-subunit dehydrogenase